MVAIPLILKRTLTYKIKNDYNLCLSLGCCTYSCTGSSSSYWIDIVLLTHSSCSTLNIKTRGVVYISIFVFLMLNYLDYQTYIHFEIQSIKFTFQWTLTSSENPITFRFLFCLTYLFHDIQNIRNVSKTNLKQSKSN